MTMNNPDCQATILVVDDEGDVRDALRRTLTSGGYEVWTAACADEAMALMRNQSFDIVMSDYDMPGANGLQLLQRVRIQSPRILRVLLTGNADLQVAVKALNEGAVDRFLLKPWDRFDLNGVLELSLHTRAAHLTNSVGGDR